MKKTVKQAAKNIRIAGFVTPVDWDRDQNVKRVSIITPHQDEYHLIPNDKTDRLLSLLWEKVEVSGRLKLVNGKKKLLVEHYTTADFDSSVERDLGGLSEDNYANDADLRELIGNWNADFDRDSLSAY